jgi:hypothetical protein
MVRFSSTGTSSPPRRYFLETSSSDTTEFIDIPPCSPNPLPFPEPDKGAHGPSVAHNSAIRNIPNIEKIARRHAKNSWVNRAAQVLNPSNRAGVDLHGSLWQAEFGP